jgi:mannose-6-phosphate isomerase-like protein (cupin superfamily)
MTATDVLTEEELAMSRTVGAEGTQDGDVRAWWFLDTLVVEHVMAAGGPVVLEMTLPAGSAPPLHVHHSLADSWYLLAGEMVVRCGDRMLSAGVGHWLSVPPGVPHAFRVVGGQPARILTVHDDRSFLDLVHDLGQPAKRIELPPPMGGPGADELSRSLADHDIGTCGPSLSEEEAQAYLAARG